MCTLLPVHQIGACDAQTKRQSGRDAFRDADNVSLDAVMLGREHLSGPAHTALHFIYDEYDAMFVTDAAQAFQETFGRRNVAAFALNGFDHDGCDFFGWGGRLEQKILDPVKRALCRPASTTHLGSKRIPILVGIWQVDYVERLPLEAQTLRGFG